LGAFYSLRESSAYAFSMATVGINYDPGNWLLMSEWARTASDGLLARSTAGYLTGGYQFGKFTPFLTLARVESARYVEPQIATPGLPPILAAEAATLSSGLAAALVQFAPSQSSVTVGMRWDLMKDVDVKLQYDRVRLDSNSDGRLSNVQPGSLAAPDVNAVSIAVDFVF
jgi:predicted porin